VLESGCGPIVEIKVTLKLPKHDDMDGRSTITVPCGEAYLVGVLLAGRCIHGGGLNVQLDLLNKLLLHHYPVVAAKAPAASGKKSNSLTKGEMMKIILTCLQPDLEKEIPELFKSANVFGLKSFHPYDELMTLVNVSAHPPPLHPTAPPPPCPSASSPLAPPPPQASPSPEGADSGDAHNAGEGRGGALRAAECGGGLDIGRREGAPRPLHRSR